MYKSFVKPFLDFIIGIIGLPFFLLALIVFGPIIHFTDGGPVFYNAERIGRNGKLFKMFKFRSMYVNSPDIRLNDGSTFNSEQDPRVTPVGKFIRNTSVDELPQILNILSGTMSLIGPRPDPPDWLGKYTEGDKVFLSVRPGLTGYSQAYYRNSVDGNEKIRNDVFYAVNCSFPLDLKIFFKTILIVFSRDNTYKDISSENEAEIQAKGFKKENQR